MEDNYENINPSVPCARDRGSELGTCIFQHLLEIQELYSQNIQQFHCVWYCSIIDAPPLEAYHKKHATRYNDRHFP